MNGTTGQTTPPDRVWSVAEHLDDILAALRPPAPVARPLLDAQGCVLAGDVTVPLPLPPFDNSSMDGYAVRAADVAGATEDAPATLTVIGDIAAGSGTLPAVGPGQAARIMTGAPLPPGAEAVVPVEWTDGGTGQGPAAAMRARSAAPQDASGEVRVHRPAAAGAHIRRAGSDARAGEPALPAGTVLGPSQLGLLAALGLDTVTVRRRPRVVVVSTGSELVQPGEPLGPGQIHDSNSFQLTAAARAAGAVAYRVGAVADDAATLRAALEDQYDRADVIVTSGGVSVGAYDVVKETLTALSADEGQMRFRKLAMQPGKPQGFGLIGPARIPLLALPGNPVSSYVSFELFVRPVIRTLMGHPEVHRPTARARVTAPLGASPRGKRQFLRGSYDPAAGTVTPVGGSGSHLIRAMAHADALIAVPEDTTDVPAGATVDVIPLGHP
ncbi:molybdopterin biosynthesis protein MoeA [Streptomyces sp. NRRL F-4489]|uniref:molybdotransferase-like divisome protein Glp n=1 Tax=Streptomyces sp. NRRL F-4489 TaxID=1609095 RepID=UPI00074A432A|nr:gephyrin-like molybdotransferase Glp [Streptomyces sp. NRRL F-4489]KUL53759.1 molybdopterin biosynthesis protein MoeA [Streptomyces sp. NRRL F-4489]